MIEILFQINLNFLAFLMKLPTVIDENNPVTFRIAGLLILRGFLLRLLGMVVNQYTRPLQSHSFLDLSDWVLIHFGMVMVKLQIQTKIITTCSAQTAYGYLIGLWNRFPSSLLLVWFCWEHVVCICLVSVSGEIYLHRQIVRLLGACPLALWYGDIIWVFNPGISGNIILLKQKIIVDRSIRGYCLECNGLLINWNLFCQHGPCGLFLELLSMFPSRRKPLRKYNLSSMKPNSKLFSKAYGIVHATFGLERAFRCKIRLSQSGTNMKSTLLSRMRVRTNWYRIKTPEHVTDVIAFSGMIWKAKKALPIWHTYLIRVGRIEKKKNSSIQCLLACKTYFEKE